MLPSQLLPSLCPKTSVNYIYINVQMTVEKVTDVQMDIIGDRTASVSPSTKISIIFMQPVFNTEYWMSVT